MICIRLTVIAVNSLKQYVMQAATAALTMTIILQKHSRLQQLISRAGTVSPHDQSALRRTCSTDADVSAQQRI